jgi:glutathione S-transferase
MLVYGHPLSSCTRKVLVTLAEKKTRAELMTVDLFAGEQKKDSWLLRHPFGVVPVLDDDGFVLLESRAILRYLERRLGGVSLVPTGTKDLARMDQWLSVDQSYVAPHTRALAIERVVKKHGGIAPEATAIEAAERALATAFDAVDRVLASSPYLAGDTFSLADISLMPYVGSLPMIGAEDLLRGPRRSHLTRWWEDVRLRPSWLEAIAFGRVALLGDGSPELTSLRR